MLPIRLSTTSRQKSSHVAEVAWLGFNGTSGKIRLICTDKKVKSFRRHLANRATLISDVMPSAKHQPNVQYRGHGPSLSHGVPVYSPAHAGIKLNCFVTEALCVNNLLKVTLDSAAAGTDLQSRIASPTP